MSAQKRGNPVASPIVRGYLFCVQGEQREVGVGVKQASPLATVQLRSRVRDTCRSARMLPTAAERIAIIQNAATFCVVFHTMKRGYELSLTVASQMLQMTGGEGS